ncbi:MAG: hypothetical protein EB078_04730 [Proteobacteria bacterium]|nr:hypothetical protein [Pseudomonadota bacterium]NDC24157.1 hypothetical protein [Pseudomonadota bacterium]NDD04188.1 hypothetical protein [Pseudomonadota bacterium]NDG27126.1 hypothetical protein [Pseudomonadota bacterium]
MDYFEKNRTANRDGALHNCWVMWGDQVAPVGDLSFSRLVVDEAPADLAFPEQGPVEVRLQLHTLQLSATVVFHSRSSKWIRLSFGKLSLGNQAVLRAFLHSKRIADSLFEVETVTSLTHYHGLNETELFIDKRGEVFFTFVEPAMEQKQFVLRMSAQGEILQIGLMSRESYLSLENMEGHFDLLPEAPNPSHWELCRGILTNWKPSVATKLPVKQKILQAISDYFLQRKYMPTKVERSRLWPGYQSH